MSIQITNIQIVSAGSVSAPCDIYIKGGLIAEVVPPGEGGGRGDTVIDGRGLHAFPGFVDLHCHLRDPGLTHKEDILTGTRAAAAGGYVTVCCMPNTQPVIDSVQTVRYVIEQSAKAGYARALPVASITRSMQGDELTDFAALRAAGAVAFSDDGLPVSDDGVILAAMRQAAREHCLLMLHEEDLGVKGNGVANAGENAEKAGLPGIPAAAEENMTVRDIELARRTGARVHICHVSTKGSVEMLRAAKKRGDRITCETAPHYFSLDDSVLPERNPNCKVNPPIRGAQDVQAIIEGLVDGTIDAIATDHAPHSPQEKVQDFLTAPFGLIGFETAFALAITHLYKKGHATLSDIAKWLCTAPRGILGMSGGAIEKGTAADLVICDINNTYTYTESMIVSKAKNSPFIGEKLTGRVMTTIKDGSVLYDHR